MNFQSLILELQKRCRDLGQIKYPEARYRELLNQSLILYPSSLWQRVVDETTLDTVAGTREYDLTGISGLLHASQVRRVWIDDAVGIKREVGRYEARGSGTELSLVLDFTPPANRDITVEYWSIPAEMVLGSDENPADDEWLLATAMVGLMGQADWEIENSDQVFSQIEYWNARASNREAQLLGERYRTSRKPRTEDWRSP